jgi:hypothetical protein
MTASTDQTFNIGFHQDLLQKSGEGDFLRAVAEAVLSRVGASDTSCHQPYRLILGS